MCIFSTDMEEDTVILSQSGAVDKDEIQGMKDLSHLVSLIHNP